MKSLLIIILYTTIPNTDIIAYCTDTKPINSSNEYIDNCVAYNTDLNKEYSDDN